MRIETISQYIDTVPSWIWQILGAFFITMVTMQVIKVFEPPTWKPYMRRKINLLLSIIIGGSSINYLYTHDMKEFVIIAFMLGNNFLYSGLAMLVEVKARANNGIWTVLHAFFRPYMHRKTYLQRSKGCTVKEKDVDTDKTIRYHTLEPGDTDSSQSE